MSFQDLPDYKKKKIALTVASAVSAMLFFVWVYQFTNILPQKVTETRKELEKLSASEKGVSSVYLSVKTEFAKITSFINDLKENKNNQEYLNQEFASTTEVNIEESVKITE